MDCQDISRPEYTVGQVAELLGMPKQSVRYFDHEGIVVPEKNQDTGRRLYSQYDVYQLIMRKKYQNIGISLRETEKIFSEYNLTQLRAVLSRHQSELEQHLYEEQIRCRGLQKLLDKLSSIQPQLGRFFYDNRPAFWGHIHIERGSFTTSPNSCQARKIAMNLLPMSTFCFSFRLCDIRSENSEPQVFWYSALPEPYAQETGFSAIDGSFCVQSVPCVHTVIQVEDTPAVRWEMLADAMGFLQANHMELCGDVYGQAIINVVDRHMPLRFYDVWLPFR